MNGAKLHFRSSGRIPVIPCLLSTPRLRDAPNLNLRSIEANLRPRRRFYLHLAPLPHYPRVFMAQPALPSRTNDVSRTTPGLTNTNAAAGLKRKRTAEPKFYAVRQGKSPGIYGTWAECLSQVKGHKGAVCTSYTPGLQEDGKR